MCQLNPGRSDTNHTPTVTLPLPMQAPDTLSMSPSSCSKATEDEKGSIQTTPKPLKVLLCSENVPRK